MTRWEALKCMVDHISYSPGWEDEGFKPLTPRWLGVLMHYAEQAEEANWSADTIRSVMDEERY